MNEFDLIKLKLLSSNTSEYVAVLLIFLKKKSINNGHDLSDFVCEYTAMSFSNQLIVNSKYIAHCKKCTFEIEVEKNDLQKTEKYVRILPEEFDVKCTGY